MPAWEIFSWRECVRGLAPSSSGFNRLRNYAQVHVLHIRRYILVPFLLRALGGAVCGITESKFPSQALFYIFCLSSLPLFVADNDKSRFNLESFFHRLSSLLFSYLSFLSRSPSSYFPPFLSLASSPVVLPFLSCLSDLVWKPSGQVLV